MRTDWLPLSASALVIGAMALVFGGVVNPTQGDGTTADTIHVIQADGGQWLAMAVMYFLASVALLLGLPCVLSLFTRRGRRTGTLGVVVFSIGVVGTAGYAVLMVFFRALVDQRLVKVQGLDGLVEDAGLATFIYGWISCFIAGVVLIALGLFLARKTAIWVPLALLVFVAMFPFAGRLGRPAMAVQLLLFAIGFTGIAIAAISDEHKRELAQHALA